MSDICDYCKADLSDDSHRDDCDRPPVSGEPSTGRARRLAFLEITNAIATRRSMPASEVSRWLDEVEAEARATRAEPPLDVEPLLRYGRHEEGCPDLDNDPPWESCTCGWAEVIDRLTTERTPEKPEVTQALSFLARQELSHDR